jgi:prepilin-type N-terminal cleavage/methylation domain-containing protein
MTFVMRQSQALRYRGFTLLEVTIVLAVVSVLSVGLWTTFNKVTSNNRLVQASQQLATLVEKMRDLYTGQSAAILSDAQAACGAATFSSTPQVPCNVSVVLGAKAGFYPLEIMRGGFPVNPWNGRYEVWIMNKQGDFSIRLQGLTTQSCADMISRVTAIGTRNSSVTAQPIPTTVARVGSLQNGLPTNIFYSSGGNWIDVTGLNPDQIASAATFETCSTLNIYYTL